jgi:signal peptidase I
MQRRIKHIIPEVYLDSVLDIWTARGEKHTCSISGNSMAPLIKHGDTMVVEHGSRDLHSGDVVIFKTQDKILAHRLIQVKKRSEGKVFICKGDNCRTFDQPFDADHILGKVVEVKSKNGHLYYKSACWRFLNYFLMILSLISQDRHKTDSIFWKGANCLFVFVSNILPKRFSIRDILLKVMLEAKKI